MKAFRDQSVAQGVEIVTDDVNKVEFGKRPFLLTVGDDAVPYSARTVIIATGAQARWLGLESESAFARTGGQRLRRVRRRVLPQSGRSSWSAEGTRRWRRRCT